MIGQLHLSPSNRGTSYSDDDGHIFCLCNGQAIPRSSYALLSAAWPSGTYGSTDIDLHLPNLNNLYLRGNDFGRGVVHDPTTRIALSGIAPSGVQIGSYQVANMYSHTHPSGSYLSSSAPAGGGPFQAGSTNTGSVTSLGPVFSGVAAHVSGSTDATDFEVPHIKMFPYICVV